MFCVLSQKCQHFYEKMKVCNSNYTRNSKATLKLNPIQAGQEVQNNHSLAVLIRHLKTVWSTKMPMQFLSFSEQFAFRININLKK